MKNKINWSVYLLLLVILFASLNAGIFAIIPVSGLGVASYMSLFIFLLILGIENGFRFKKFCLPFCFAFFWLLFLLVIKPNGTFNGLYQWFLGGLVLFSFNYIDESDNSVFYLVMISLLTILFFSIFEMITGVHLSWSRYSYNGLSSMTPLGVHIPTAIFVNENDFGVFLILSFCYLRTIRYGKKILFDTTFLPIIVFFLWLASARLCLIALGLYYFYLFVEKFSKKVRIAIYVIVGIIFIYCFVKLIIPFIVEALSLQSFRSTIVRLNLILISIEKIFFEKKIFGLGPASFPSIVESDPRVGGIGDPHNFYIELGIEVGLLFLVFYLIFILYYFIYEKNKQFKAFFLAFLICCFLPSRFSRELWNWFFLAFFLKRFFYMREKK